MSTASKKWYREFWPWALMMPPLAAVVGGVTMIVLAIRTSGELVVSDYARIEELTSERFTLDREALRLGVVANLEFSDAGVALTLAGSAPLPEALTLHLQHATDAAKDRNLVLVRSGERFSSTTAVGPGRYRIELLPADRGWRLASGTVYPSGRLTLRPQHPGG